MDFSNCRAAIFDLDGTLLDTLKDIADAANRALASRGFPTHPHEAQKPQPLDLEQAKAREAS